MMTTILSKLAARERVESLTPDQRRCLAARLYEECTASLLEAVENAPAGSWGDSPRVRRLHEPWSKP
ncbi:hypothetical protein [Hyalangium versicolor]|uniref:hypothetical protein n=1 Tax=Hyalangium versicolor TaxID=2861190 RepID=UPI001CCD2A76|nr:hypothetical protein [Hyalangium versicolor]